MSSRTIIGPFNRVEGDLEVQVEVAEQKVSNAWVVSPLYRGFEQMLHGKSPLDALVYVPRICGICSVAQSVAAATALANLTGQVMPANGRLASNLILACENLADHLTHFYLFFMPDFAREAYAKHSFFDAAEARFKAGKGHAYNQVLPARAQFLKLTGILAGKWPHSLALQPGGTTCAVQAREKHNLLTLLFGFREFLEQVLFGDRLENITALASEQDLNQWQVAHSPERSDFSHFLNIAEHLELANLGRAYDQFLSYGAYPNDDKPLFKQGTFNLKQGVMQLDQNTISEDISHSWMRESEPRHPLQGMTEPELSERGYSWCKSPRLAGLAMEVGAVARQLVNGQPLITDLIKREGANVRTRVIARLLELALVTQEMETWAKALEPGAPFCNAWQVPDQGQAYGLMEAARGSLGHWLSVRDGKIANYQIIAPTTWNFSPRDSNEQLGPLEYALLHTPITGDAKKSVAIQHIVRSFDPCMVCTVH